MPHNLELDPRIAAATLPVAATPLFEVRLMDDSRYPWLVLVPRRPGVEELFDLAPADRHALIDLAAHLAAGLASAFAADKMNVGTLGNRVRPFHLHVVARRLGDAAWPDAVWNGSAAVPYEASEREAVLDRMRGLVPSHG